MAGEKKTILLIDDDAFILEIYSLQFKKEGFDVLIAKSSKEAFEILKQEKKPELILLDIILPEMTGLEFLEKLRKDFPKIKIPIVILSNVGQEESIARARAFSVDDYIIKANFTPSEVVKKVRRFLK